MSNKGNKYKVGVLVIGSTIALFISLLSLGVLQYFQTTYPFMTVIKTSVLGLQKGCKVTFKGVKVGSIKDIQLDTIGTNNDIYVIMEFDPKAFLKSSKFMKSNDSISLSNEQFIKIIKEKIKQGLRCQVNYEGITGQQYIEISYFDIKEHPIKKIELFENHPPYIPSVESASVSNILAESQKAIQKIAKVDFEKISKDLENVLASTSKLLNNENLQESIKDIKEISNNLKLLTGRLNVALNENRITNISDKLNESLKNFNQVMLSTNSLINYLEQNPQSLLKGKPNRPVVNHE
jgi:paraquat-inducible protein B